METWYRAYCGEKERKLHHGVLESYKNITEEKVRR
jgi:hypothetical protein